MKTIIIILLGTALYCFAGSSIGSNPENQFGYDKFLGSVLTGNFSKTNRFCFFSRKSPDETCEVGDELQPHELSIEGPQYKYHIKSLSLDGVVIKATPIAKGRPYFYDSKWNVVYYSFESPEEELQIGRQILRWMVDDDLPDDEVSNLLDLLAWRGSVLPEYLKSNTKYDVLGGVGGFLVHEELREKLWKIVRGGKVYKNSRGREIVIRSILSRFDDYPDDLKQEVARMIELYIPKVFEEKAIRTDDIVNFYKGKKLQDAYPSDIFY